LKEGRLFSYEQGSSMDFQDLTGQWIGQDQPCAVNTGFEIQTNEVIFHPPEAKLEIPSQHWPAEYNLADGTLTVTFTGHNNTQQTLEFQVLDNNKIRDKNGYDYKRCTVEALS